MKYMIPIFCLVFGLMTLKEGGSVLFVDGPERETAGNFVGWVLGFNFFTGFAFLAAAYGFGFHKKWVKPLTTLIAGFSFLALIGFLLLVLLDHPYEKRTLIALPLRTLLWIGLTWFAIRKDNTMKTLTTALLILTTLPSVSLAGENHNDHHNDHPHPATPAASPAKSASKNTNLFSVDAKLMEKMETIGKLLQSLESMEASLVALKQVGTQLESTVQDIFKTCQLSPEADHAIHPLLADILKGASLLKKGKLEGKTKIAPALKNYGQIFAHPHWAY